MTKRLLLSILCILLALTLLTSTKTIEASPQTPNTKTQLKLICDEKEGSLPEFCLRFIFEDTEIDYNEALAVLWCESAFNQQATGDLDIFTLGSSGLAQVSWEKNGYELGRAGYDRADLYGTQNIADIISIIQRKGVWILNEHHVVREYGDSNSYWQSYHEFVLEDSNYYPFETYTAYERWALWTCKNRFREFEHRADDWKMYHLGVSDPYWIELQKIADTLVWNLRGWKLRVDNGTGAR